MSVPLNGLAHTELRSDRSDGGRDISKDLREALDVAALGERRLASWSRGSDDGEGADGEGGEGGEGLEEQHGETRDL